MTTNEPSIESWGTHVYLWQIHFDIRQNQYNIVKLKNKIKFKKKKLKKKTKWSFQRLKIRITLYILHIYS